MSEHSFNQPLDKEVSLKDIIDFLLESWKTIALSGIIGGLLAVGYAFITPPKYQATANIQVARVAGIDVEAPNVLVEKMKMPMFYSAASHAACKVFNVIDSDDAISKNIKVVSSKTSPIISFSYVQESPQDAKKCIESILNDVRASQNILAKPIIEIKKNQLELLKKKLNTAEKYVKTFPGQNLTFDFSDSKFSASALLLATSLSMENDIKDFRTQIMNLEVALLEPETRMTSLVAPIYAPKHKISPQRPQILIGGVLAGIFLGLVLVTGLRVYRSYKASGHNK